MAIVGSCFIDMTAAVVVALVADALVSNMVTTLPAVIVVDIH